MLLIVILVLSLPGNSQQPPCTIYKVRPDSNSYGRLQICWSDGSSRPQWYSVCSVLNDVAAALVCRQLRQLDFNTGNQGTFGVGLHSLF